MEDRESIDYGVCRLALVSVRQKPEDKAVTTTQLLFGDHYSVVAVSSDKWWLQIVCYFDQSTGWIHRLQHHSISKEYFDQINQAEFKITTDVVSTILYKKSPLSILIGSVVPIAQSELFKIEEQFAFNGDSKSLGQRRDFEFMKTILNKYLSAPELKGGKSPFGIDASGLNQMVFKICGYALSRSLEQQMLQGKKISDVEMSQPGDIAFFGGLHGTIDHAGIMVDQGKIIHAYGHVRVDMINEEGIINPETKIYSHTLKAIRRVLND